MDPRYFCTSWHQVNETNQLPKKRYLVLNALCRIAELKPENVTQVDKPSSAEELANVINVEATSSTEVLQPVQEDREIVEEPQVPVWLKLMSLCNRSARSTFSQFTSAAIPGGDIRLFRLPSVASVIFLICVLIHGTM